LYKSHFVRSISSSRRAIASLAAASAARPSSRRVILNPFFPISATALSIEASKLPTIIDVVLNRTAAVSVTKFTAAASTSSRASSAFRTAALHPPHRIPSIANSTVELDDSSDDALDDVADVSSSRIAMARVDANAHRRESPSRARVEFDGARARATTHRARERGRASDANARTHARWHATRGIGRATRDDDD
jgi:hypothetical protein